MSHVAVKLACIALFSGVVSAQTKQTTGNAETTGICSPANTGAITTLTINCSGLSPAEKKLLADLPALLNRMLSQQVSPSVFLNALDELKNGQARIESGVLRLESGIAGLRTWCVTQEQKDAIGRKLRGTKGTVSIWRAANSPNAAYFAESWKTY